MLRRSLPRSLVVSACLGMAGCATTASDERARIIDMPLASTHADIAFTMTTGSRQDAACADGPGCPNAVDRVSAAGFARQVQRVADRLQAGARDIYPDLAQRVPGLVDKRFDVYVVDGDEPGSESSANGRIALNAALGARPPYDDWVAFVIAREMGHVIARHHEENSAAGIVTSVILNLLIPGSGWLKSAISAGGSSIAAKSKREVQAQEADVIALKLLEAGGFRLGDVSLSLLIAPALSGGNLWSKNFKDSADSLRAEVRRQEFALASTR